MIHEADLDSNTSNSVFPSLTEQHSQAPTDHVCKGRDEEEEDGADAHYGAVCARLDDSLGHRLEGHWEELEHGHTQW